MQKLHTESSSYHPKTMDEEKQIITRERKGRVVPLGYKVSEEDDKVLIQIPQPHSLLL